LKSSIVICYNINRLTYLVLAGTYVRCASWCDSVLVLWSIYTSLTFERCQ